ncbi:PEP/pyruvate-binding domain-containing protein [Treponema pedis]|uniref:Phosphoenolpyruvate synthase n=1 Tax=Treponema pedis TaxID=409322 RepID=A0A7S6WPH8_9SPIR|nr:PEP/pyruvate-binding domain-containing protein [Treponema pedis]QOW60944.1 hypothetical protein IFE08_00505 [Treponema pedis]
MRQWIMGQETSTELKTICADFISKSKAKAFVVRSSASCEDGEEKTFAGCFETILNITSIEEVTEAIKSVYSSKYSYIIPDTSLVTMGVILQEQIEADYSGVAFSINPITGVNEIVINYTEGACEKVVSGQELEEIILNREGCINLNKKIPNTFLEKIRQNVLDIENLFSMPIDVEWAIAKKKLYILQARKITTIIKKTKIRDKNIYIDSMDIDILNKLDLGLIQNSHKKYMEKHFIIRKQSIEAGINFPEVGYLFYNKRNLTQEILNDIIPDALVYKISINNFIRTIAKTEVLNFLKSFEEEDNIIRIQKITITTACGNVSLTSEGNIYVEYIPGGFGGFLFGELPYSNYLLDPKGNILQSNELIYNKMWKFDEDTKKFKETKYKDFTYNLSKSILLQLIQLALKCKMFFPNTRIEWELEDDKVYLNDISFENNKILDSILLEKKLSEGIVKGEIRIIDNLEDVKAIIKNRSIIPESEFYKTQRSNNLKEYLKKIDIDEAKKYVFICKYAHPSLSILIPYSSGFIFEKGGILSHLAIILRENKIPAFLKDNAISIYKDCKYI